MSHTEQDVGLLEETY